MREQLAQLAKKRDVAVLKVEQQLHTINRFTKYDDSIAAQLRAV